MSMRENIGSSMFISIVSFPISWLTIKSCC